MNRARRRAQQRMLRTFNTLMRHGYSEEAAATKAQDGVSAAVFTRSRGRKKKR